MAASEEDGATGDGETFIEKYTRGVSAVETILTLDRLRQSVAVKELLSEKIKQQAPTPIVGLAPNGGVASQFMRKTVSVPNFTQVMSTSLSLDNVSNLSKITASESFSDLNSEASASEGGNGRRHNPAATSARGSARPPSEDPNSNNMPFGLGK